ncbi:MAG: hypothetical protein H0W36_08955 [Gemmatimonadetes bacterium]|nr:hypothetical protein [Gemmatimonadota bacterium]
MRYRFNRGLHDRFRSRKGIALLGAFLAAATLSGVGLADVWSTWVSQDTTNTRLRVQHFSTNNFDSGWHSHPGAVIVQVEQGSLSYTGRNCVKKTYGPGDTFIEIPYVPARVVGVGYAKFTATFLVGYGDPLSAAAATVTCP